MGRKKKEGPRLELPVNTRFTADDWAEIEFTCSVLNIKPADLLREAALERIKRERRLLKDIELSGSVQVNLMAIAECSRQSPSKTVEDLLKRFIKAWKEDKMSYATDRFGKLLGRFSYELKELEEKFEKK